MREGYKYTSTIWVDTWEIKDGTYALNICPRCGRSPEILVEGRGTYPSGSWRGVARCLHEEDGDSPLEVEVEAPDFNRLIWDLSIAWCDEVKARILKAREEDVG